MTIDHRKLWQNIRAIVPRGHWLSWVMLLITTLSILMNSIDRLILPTLLPTIIEEFGLTEIQAGWLNSLSFVGALLGALILGFWSDHIGGGYKRARGWFIAVAIEVAAGVASAYAFSYKTFMALRLAMGFGSGGAEPINVSLISEWWHKENRGFAIGVHHTGFPLGQFAGPALIGLILATTGAWRDVFLFIPLLGVPIIVLQMVLSTRSNHDKVMHWIDKRGLPEPRFRA